MLSLLGRSRYFRRAEERLKRALVEEWAVVAREDAVFFEHDEGGRSRNAIFVVDLPVFRQSGVHPDYRNVWELLFRLIDDGFHSLTRAALRLPKINQHLPVGVLRDFLHGAQGNNR